MYRLEVLALAKVEGIIVKKQKSKKKKEREKESSGAQPTRYGLFRIKVVPRTISCRLRQRVNRQSEGEGPTLVQIRCPLKQLN